MNIGYVGLGRTGGEVVRRLLRSHKVMVFDARTSLVEQFTGSGATAAPDLASLGRACDVIMIRVPPSGLKEVVFGPLGLANNLVAGKVLVDQTAGGPIEARHMASELERLGVDMIDASICEAIMGAGQGAMSIVCGGRAETFAKIRPIFECLSSDVMLCGSTGTGHAARLINNALDVSNRMITCEMASMGVKLGLDCAVMDAVTNGKGSGRSDASERILPTLGSGRRATGLSLQQVAEELARVFQLGVSFGAPLFIGNAVRSLVETGVNQLGPDAAVGDLPHFYEVMGGFQFAKP